MKCVASPERSDLPRSPHTITVVSDLRHRCPHHHKVVGLRCAGGAWVVCGPGGEVLSRYLATKSRDPVRNVREMLTAGLCCDVRCAAEGVHLNARAANMALIF
eukprot:904617-Prorocentrum_minimum.AAC.1